MDTWPPGADNGSMTDTESPTPTYTDQLPTYAAMWRDPNDCQGVVASFLRPLSTEAAQGLTCDGCSLDEDPRGHDPLYRVVEEGIAQHLSCFLALCTAHVGAGTLLLSLVPCTPPLDYED